MVCRSEFDGSMRKRCVVPDVPLCDVFKLVREKVEKEKPELASKMTNNLGFVKKNLTETSHTRPFVAARPWASNSARVRLPSPASAPPEQRRVGRMEMLMMRPLVISVDRNDFSSQHWLLRFGKSRWQRRPIADLRSVRWRHRRCQRSTKRRAMLTNETFTRVLSDRIVQHSDFIEEGHQPHRHYLEGRWSAR